MLEKSPMFRAFFYICKLGHSQAVRQQTLTLSLRGFKSRCPNHIKTQRLIQKSLRFLFCLKRRNIVVSRTQRNDGGEVYRFFVQKNQRKETIAEYNETIAPMVAFFRGGCMFAVSLEFSVSLLRITKNRGTLKQKSGCPISLFCNI